MVKVGMFIMTFCVANALLSQDLIKRKVTSTDLNSGIREKYEYTCEDSYCGIQLTLYNNHTFKYSMQSFDYDAISTGTWTQLKDILIIKSFIRKDSVPIKLFYSNDTSGMINKFSIAVIRNTKGNLMDESFVRINNDSIQCWPAIGQCTKTYKSIDSLKFTFGNGMSSQWIKIENTNWVKIIPVVQSELLITSYLPLIRKYKFGKSRLSFVEDYE